MKNTREGITEEEREQYREWGRMGGKKVAEKYGADHMSAISRGDDTTPRAPKAPKTPRAPAPVRHAAAVQPAEDPLNDFV